MSERPKLKIVGGTDFVPKQTPEKIEKPKITADDLVKSLVDATGKVPEDFISSTRAELVNESAMIVRAWTVEQLHTYLENQKKWAKPSFTKAVMDEIAARIRRGNFQPK